MSQNIMPMAKLLSRKLLPLMKPQGRVQAGCQPLRLVNSGRVKKVSPLTTLKPSRGLSPGESQLAEALANIKDNYQRPNEDLIEAMRKKRRFRTPTVEQEEPPAEPPQHLSTVEDPDPIAVAEPAPIADPNQTQATITSTSEPPQQTEDWEEKAKRIINQENLSLNRGWSKFTWKQKASNVVRLKLLKDDGYDITPLQVKGTSADQIIEALLAHVDARAQLAPVPNISTAPNINVQSEPVPKPEEREVAETQDEEILAVAPGETMDIDSISRGSDVTDNEIVRPGPRVSPEGMFYPTVQIIGQKRKHSHDDEDQPEWNERQPQAHLHTMYNEIRPQRDSLSAGNLSDPSCTCGMPGPKRLCLVTPDEMMKTINGKAHELVKKRISRRIFKSSREVCKTFRIRSTADGKPLSAPKLPLTPDKPVKPSRIVFTQACTPANQPSGGDVYMGSVGSDLIEEEMKFLSSYLDEDGRHCMHNPESGEDMDGDLLMEYNGPVHRAFRHDIRMTSGENQPTIIEGDPRALMSLIEHLKKEDLHHLCRYLPIDISVDRYGERDVEMKVLKNDSIPFHLNEAICSVLEKVKGLLEEGQGVGGNEIRVGVVPQRALYRVH